MFFGPLGSRFGTSGGASVTTFGSTLQFVASSVAFYFGR